MEFVNQYRDILQSSALIQNLSKCFLVEKNEKIAIRGIEFYKHIYNHPFWKVHFNNVHMNTIIRDDALPTKFDVNKEEIKYTLIRIPYRECKNNNIPLEYHQLIHLKKDELSRYEIA